MGSLRRRTIHLSRYWNARTTGVPSPELSSLAARIDPTYVESIEQLIALDDARDPDPIFAQRLERDLMRAIAINQRNLALLTPPLAITGNGRFGPPARSLPLPRPSLPSRARRWAATQLATAIMLVLVIVGSVYVFYDNRSAVLPTVQTSPTAEPATPAEDWPMYRGDPARTGNLPVTGPSGTPVELWRYQTGGRIHAAPAVVGGILYAASEDGNLYALNAATGAEVWVTPLGSGSGASVVVDGGVVYVVDNNHALHAIDAATGQERWRYDGLGATDPGPVGAGVYFAAGDDGSLHALDAAAGEELWSTPLGGGGASRATAYADGAIYVGSQDGRINATDAASGALRWSFDLGGGTVGTPAVLDGVVYASNFSGPDNKLVALDAATGTQLWIFQTEARADLRSPAVGGGAVYTVSGDGNLYALDAATGGLTWSFQTDGAVTAAPALASDTLYAVSKDRNVYAVNAATGQEIWRFDFGSTTDYGPIVANEMVYLTADAGYIMAIGSAGEASADGSPEATSAGAPGGAATTGATATSASTVAPIATTGSPVEFVWSATGDPSRPLQTPDDIVIDPQGRLWVADGSSRFHIFDLDGTFLEAWGIPGSGDGQFNFVRANGDTYGGVVFAADGSIYVVDTGNLRVQQFDRDRAFVRSWGGQGTSDGQFLDPLSIAIDAQGQLYVLDDLRDDVQIFDPDGNLLRKFRVHEALGLEANQFNSSNQVAVDHSGNVYVTSVLESAVLRFDSSGAFVGQIGGFGTGDGQFGQPIEVAIDDAGHLFVTDWPNNRVEVFDADGQFLLSWGSAGSADGELNGPAGIAVRGQYVYVADWFNNRVQKYRLVAPLGPD